MKSIFKVIIILVSILSIGAIPDSNNKDFYLLEKQLKKNNETSENGVRVQYEVSNKFNEYEKIKTKFSSELGENLIIKEDSLTYEDEGNRLIASFSYNEDKTIVQIDFINKGEELTTKEIKNKLKEIINKNSKNIRYFSFIKIKIKEESKNYNYDLIDKNLLDKKMIKIENGEIGTGFLKNSTRVNIGYVRYNTGDYIIVGTPVIFVTY